MVIQRLTAKMHMQRPIGYVLVATLLFIGLAGCGGDDENGGGSSPWAQQGERQPPSVEAVVAEFGALPLEARVNGTVRARNQVELYPEVGGTVTAVHAESGDYVEEGQVLVELRDRVFRDRIRQAEADLRIAEADARSARATLAEAEARLARTERLVEREFESEQELESLRAEVESAEASVDQAESRVAQAQAVIEERQEDLRETTVRAPFSGYLGDSEVSVGQRVDTSERLFTLGDFQNVRVRVPIPDRLYGQIQAGQTVNIMPDGQADNPVQAEVSRISPFLSSDSYSARAEIDVVNDEERLLPGMFVQVDIFYGETDQATLIPRSALYENPTTGERGVFVAAELGDEVPIEPTSDSESEEDDKPPLTDPTPTNFVPVDIVAQGRDVAGIRGIDPGDWVVTVGQEMLMRQAEHSDEARIRPMAWERIMSLQRLQDQNVLLDFLERHQQMVEERFRSESPEADTASDSDAEDDATSTLHTERSVGVTPTR